ncbi:mechanosensitive ion channel family protein [Rhizobium sp. ZW T2_16]|uniref:mechanosensitive ion channel family protein n=1 Tax=Rhizobium sp. ZW T2_16 TaxID=3378083 RepID=UPI0038551A3D
MGDDVKAMHHPATHQSPYPTAQAREFHMKLLLTLILILCSNPIAEATVTISKLDDERASTFEQPTMPTSSTSNLFSQAAPAPDEDAAVGIVSWEKRTRARIHAVLLAISLIPHEARRALEILVSDVTENGYLPVSAAFALLVAAGAAAERSVRRNRLNHWDGLEQYLPSLVLSVLIAPLYFIVNLPLSVRLIAGSYLLLFVAYRFASALVDHVALYPVRRKLKTVIGLSLFTAAAIVVGDVLLIDPDVITAIEVLASCVILMLVMRLTWTTAGRDAAVNTALSLYTVGAWLLWCLDARAFFWLSVYPALLPPILRSITRVVQDVACRKLHIPVSNSRTILLVRGGRAFVLALALAWLAFVWETDINFPGHDIPLVHRALYGLVRGALVLLVADIIWHLAKVAIDRMLAQQSLSSAEPHENGEIEHSTRLQTLLPILRNVLAVVIFVVSGLTILGQIGVDIGPLVAGAGIIGVAIGFGSQALVRDIISGFFYLFDDAFRVGEYIQAKDYRGTVEGFSLRSVKLRHHRGPIFTVPFGELGAVENMSRDWSKTKILVTVPYDTDLEKVRKIGKAIGQALLADPEVGRFFLEPLKLKGVEDFAEYGIVISFAMITVPTAQQSFIKRTAYASLRKAFQENGVTFAQPTVNIGGKDSPDLIAASWEHQRAKASGQANG